MSKVLLGVERGEGWVSPYGSLACDTRCSLNLARSASSHMPAANSRGRPPSLACSLACSLPRPPLTPLPSLLASPPSRPLPRLPSPCLPTYLPPSFPLSTPLPGLPTFALHSIFVPRATSLGLLLRSERRRELFTLQHASPRRQRGPHHHTKGGRRVRSTQWRRMGVQACPHK